MSTLEATRRAASGRNRLRTLLLGLGALIAIGLTALVLALSDSNHALHARSSGRNVSPSLASVLAPLTPQARQYVLGITSMTPAQQAAAYGTAK
jgi:hypothetical protein